MVKDAKVRSGDTDWFTHDRFGLFIHWGLYALPARHEWVQANEQITAKAYSTYFKHFDPDLYDPRPLGRGRIRSGHEILCGDHQASRGILPVGFKTHPLQGAPIRPAGRDLLSPMVDAFREQNMRVGFYHSLIDWHHPHYRIDPYIGPYRQSPRRKQMNRSRDPEKYAAHLHGQVRELLTQYGEIDVLWFDFSFPHLGPEGKGHKDWRSQRTA